MNTYIRMYLLVVYMECDVVEALATAYVHRTKVMLTKVIIFMQVTQVLRVYALGTLCVLPWATCAYHSASCVHVHSVVGLDCVCWYTFPYKATLIVLSASLED